MSKGFFSRWREGMNDYSSGIKGQLEIKRVFYIVIVVGLFGGSIERLVDGDFWMFLVLFGFGVIVGLDLKNTITQLNNINKTMEEYKNV